MTINQRMKRLENMIFNVAQLMKAPVGTSLVNDFQEDTIQFDDDIKVIGPLNGHVRMRRTNQGLLVDGWVDLTLELSCNRCLKEFEQPMHIKFEEQFYPTVDVVSGLPLAPFDENEIFPIDAHHQVDLTEAIRQNLLLELPMVVVCKQDCKGLCPQCGQDLNLGSHSHEPEVDTRLSVLKTLLQNEP
jgi:uncharacterized protein